MQNRKFPCKYILSKKWTAIRCSWTHWYSLIAKSLQSTLKSKKKMVFCYFYFYFWLSDKGMQPMYTRGVSLVPIRAWKTTTKILERIQTIYETHQRISSSSTDYLDQKKKEQKKKGKKTLSGLTHSLTLQRSFDLSFHFVQNKKKGAVCLAAFFNIHSLNYQKKKKGAVLQTFQLFFQTNLSCYSNKKKIPLYRLVLGSPF